MSDAKNLALMVLWLGCGMAVFFLGAYVGRGNALRDAGQAGVVPVQCVGQAGWHLSCEVEE
jgi:hypothetical protein